MAYSDSVLADSPLAYWRLDETTGATQFADASGNGHQATISGTPSYSTTNYVQNSAVQFSGTQYGSAASGAWFGSMTSYSVEAWFASTATGNSMIVSYDNTGTSPGAATRVFQLYLSGGKVCFVPLLASGSYVVLTSSAQYNDAAYHHVVATWDGSNAKLYVDGSQVATAALSGTTTTGGGQPILIGTGYNNSPGNLYQYSGYIDEVALYGPALTSTQVSTHFSAASPVQPPSAVRVEANYVEAMTGGAAPVQVEANYVEALTGGGVPTVQVEANYIEAMLGNPAPTVQVESTYLEVLQVNPAVQVETVYAEALATGTPDAQVESVYSEALAAATPDAQVELIYTEALINSPRMQTESVYSEAIVSGAPLMQTESSYVEAIAAGMPSAQTESVYAEAIAGGTPFMQTQSVYLEVLAPSYPAPRFVGWGLAI
ncbi:MAG TPA: LamG-like jellyroll fold domain-containing protein [Patescibacteria group bacterium]|nr:LamG-like jellyroll fold domain-containing protein [Patescibacteria group bacterium]